MTEKIYEFGQRDYKITYYWSSLLAVSIAFDWKKISEQFPLLLAAFLLKLLRIEKDFNGRSIPEETVLWFWYDIFWRWMEVFSVLF